MSSSSPLGISHSSSTEFVDSIYGYLHESPGSGVFIGGTGTGKSAALLSLWENRAAKAVSASLIIRMVDSTEAQGFQEAPWLVLGQDLIGNPFSMELLEYLQVRPFGPAELAVPWSALNGRLSDIQAALSKMVREGLLVGNPSAIHLYLDDPALFLEDGLPEALYETKWKNPTGYFGLQFFSVWRKAPHCIVGHSTHLFSMRNGLIDSTALPYATLQQEAAALRPFRVSHHIKNDIGYTKTAEGSFPQG